MEEYELYRELGMLDEVITYNVKDDGSFRDNLPFFGGKYIAIVATRFKMISEALCVENFSIIYIFTRQPH